MSHDYLVVDELLDGVHRRLAALGTRLSPGSKQVGTSEVCTAQVIRPSCARAADGPPTNPTITA